MDMKLSKEPDFNADSEEESNRYSFKGENTLPMKAMIVRPFRPSSLRASMYHQR